MLVFGFNTSYNTIFYLQNRLLYKKQNLAVFKQFFLTSFMVEPLLSGIVLGLVPVTMAGLFVTAYLQYRRGDRVTNSL